MEVLGQYIITKEIGSGGMGKVWRAWKISSSGFRKLVAIKTLKSREHINLFVNEAKISANFEHENVLKTLDFGEISGKFFIAMEYIRGANLKEIIDEVKEIPPDIFFFIAEKVLSAVEYIHNFGGMNLVHRDINPKNILVSWVGNVKLSDFGITLPQNGGIDPFGKLSYVPPEVLMGSGWSQQGDIWSVGVMFWEILTSKKLFQGKNPDEVKESILKSIIPPPSSINPTVPEGIDRVIMKALSKTPAGRYATAEEMLMELKNAAEKSGIPKIYQNEFAKFVSSFFVKRIKKESEEINHEEREISKLMREMIQKGKKEEKEKEKEEEKEYTNNTGKIINTLTLKEKTKGGKIKEETESKDEKERENKGEEEKKEVEKERRKGKEKEIQNSEDAKNPNFQNEKAFILSTQDILEEKAKGVSDIQDRRESEPEEKWRETQKGSAGEKASKRRRKNKERSSLYLKNHIIPITLGFIVGFSLGIGKSMIDMKKAISSFEMGKILLKSQKFHEAKEFIEKSAEISELPEIKEILSEVKKGTVYDSDFQKSDKKR